MKVKKAKRSKASAPMTDGDISSYAAGVRAMLAEFHTDATGMIRISPERLQGIISLAMIRAAGR